jgi:hypothetical protein
MKLIDEARQEAIESLPGRWREMANIDRQKYPDVGGISAAAFECAANMLEVCLQYKVPGDQNE